MRISIIMLHYSDLFRDMTRQARAAVEGRTTEPHEIIVWTNGDSEDGVGTKERLSLAKAYNLAAQQATGDLICFMHNDTVVTHGWLDGMVEVAQAGDVAFPTIKVNDEIAAARGVPAVPEWMPPSCCFLLSRDLWDRLGGYDETFVGCHFEDMDLFKRAEALGARLRQCPGQVHHLRGVTRGLMADECNDAFRRNERIYAARYPSPRGAAGTYILPVMTLCTDSISTSRMELEV